MREMGKDFNPDIDALDQLNKAGDVLEEVLKKISGSIKNFKNATVNLTDAYERRYNLFSADWYDAYSSLIKGPGAKLSVLAEVGGINFLKREPRRILLAKISISPFPGCCGICVINDLLINSDYRKQGLGKALIAVAEALAKVINYSFTVGTTHKVNGPARKAIENSGSNVLGKFVNARTKHSIMIYGRNINPNGLSLTDDYDRLEK
jgi:GNAT superfamily N-acetyltransferase